jgi:hypothetical protein
MPLSMTVFGDCESETDRTKGRLKHGDRCEGGRKCDQVGS